MKSVDLSGKIMEQVIRYEKQRTMSWFARLNTAAPRRWPFQVRHPPKKDINRIRRLVLMLKVTSGCT